MPQAANPSPADWAALQDAITGEVMKPGSPGYDEARRPAIARFRDSRPQAVVFCATAGDVAEALSVARRFRLPAVPRSGGHCFAGRSSTAGMVIDVTPMRSVSVADGPATTGSTTTGSATIGAGARLGEVYDALAGHGLTIAAGCGPGVGIAGLALGGGLGILGRRYGLTCDQLLAARVVRADGQLTACDDDHASDLFWGLRGGGTGTFGVVTSLTLRTVPAPAGTVFHLTWPHDHAGRVIRAWQEWAPAGPDELAASLLITAAGTGVPAVNVFGALLGGEATAARLLGGLATAIGTDPLSAHARSMASRDIKRYLAELGDHMSGGGPEEGHSFVKSEFFSRPLPDGAVAALVAGFGRDRRPGQARELDFSPWGGAYNRVSAQATAFPHRDARFLLKHSVTVSPAGDRPAARGWLARSWAAVHPWGTGGAYPNFPDPDLPDPGRACYLGNYDRLRQVKARYDPDGFFGSL
jgi:FAD/FMN-containing dehydrogenase